MISYLKGKIQFKQKDSIIVVVENIGYEVFAPVPMLNSLKVEDEIEVFTHEYMRENSRELFGFPDQAELSLFRDLMKVSGVGPRMALNVLSLGFKKVKEAISKGDSGFISTVSGVGKKTAQKIVLELKGVLSETGELTSVDEDVIQALKRLGYTQSEAREAVQSVEEAEGTEDKLKSALMVLGKR